jgi:hypothetical protein
MGKNMDVLSFKRTIKKQISNELIETFKKYSQEGKYPWQGFWLTKRHIERAQMEIRKKDRVILIEIIILFFVLLITCITLYNFLLSLLPD